MSKEKVTPLKLNQKQRKAHEKFCADYNMTLGDGLKYGYLIFLARKGYYRPTNEETEKGITS